MSFDDLPDNWTERPITDPAIVDDVLDLLVSERARHDGAILLAICDHEARLVQPCVLNEVEGLPHDERVDIVRRFLDLVSQVEPVEAVLAARARRGGLSVTRDDESWAEAVRSACGATTELLGVHLVTNEGSRPVPRRRAA